MGYRDLTADTVLAAINEFDSIGRPRFLEKYGFHEARSIFVVRQGRSYDSKALAGAAHGYLPGQRPLLSTEFSGGWSHAAGVLKRLGFDVVDIHASTTAQAVIAAIERLRPATVSGYPMLKQAVVLLWAIGRAQRGETRLASWDQTCAELGPLLTQYRRDGERTDPRPDYPIAALCRAGLWALDSTDPVPPAHGDAELRRWFGERQPHSGFPEPAYQLLRHSGVARVQVIAAIVDRFFDDADYTTLIAVIGLNGDSIADDEPSNAESSVSSARPDPHHTYQELVGTVAAREAKIRGKRRATTSHDPVRLAAARRAVILRSEGSCENPNCGNPAPDLTDSGLPVLEVDHIADIATGGRDHPVQMIALCPNCHAVKTRGQSRHHLRERLLTAARERHHEWTTNL